MMRLKKRFLFVVSAVVVLFSINITPAMGQSTPVESYVYSFGGWNLVDVRNDADQVMGYWGIPAVPVAVGNIRRLWFEALPNNEWAVWAFEPIALYTKVGELVTQGASAGSISFLMYQEQLNANSAINNDIDGGVTGQVVKGFIAGDPLVEAAGSLSDPDPMIDLLADIGYPIAPGISDLLVDGTAGANVGMNAATKQTLDCMRSSNSACGACVCVRTERMMVLDPNWTIIETLMSDGRLRCEYSRFEHHWYWQWGEDPNNNCVDCTAGTAESPIPYDVVIERTEFWLDIEHCADTPLNP